MLSRRISIVRIRRARGLAARRVELRACRLTGAELAEATLSDVTFTDCRLDLVGLRIAESTVSSSATAA